MASRRRPGGSTKRARADARAAAANRQQRDTPLRRADLRGVPDHERPARLTVHLDRDVARRLRVLAADQEWSLSFAVEEAVRALLYEHGLEPEER